MVKTFNIVCNSSEFSALLAILKKTKVGLSGNLTEVISRNGENYYSVKITYTTAKTTEQHTIILWCLGLITGESSNRVRPTVFSNN